jgi:hypothetical protein
VAWLVKDYDTTTAKRKNDDLRLSDLEFNADTQELSEPSLPSTPWRPSLSERSSALFGLELDTDTQDPSLRLAQTPSELGSELTFRHWAFLEAKTPSLTERRFASSHVLELERVTTTNGTGNSHHHECLLDVDQYLDDQANHLLFLSARPWWLCHPDVELEVEVDIVLDASHSCHRVDHIRGVLQKLDSHIDDIPLEDDSFSVDVLIRPTPVVLSSEILIPGDLMEQELAIEDDLERGTRRHATIHDTEQNSHPSNFVEAYCPRRRSILVLCNVDKTGISFILQVLALFAIGFTVMLIYAVKKHDLGTGTGLCALIWTAGGAGYATYRKVFPPDEDDSSGRELELREVSRRSS